MNSRHNTPAKPPFILSVLTQRTEEDGEHKSNKPAAIRDAHVVNKLVLFALGRLLGDMRLLFLESVMDRDGHHSSNSEHKEPRSNNLETMLVSDALELLSTGLVGAINISIDQGSRLLLVNIIGSSTVLLVGHFLNRFYTEEKKRKEASGQVLGSLNT